MGPLAALRAAARLNVGTAERARRLRHNLVLLRTGAAASLRELTAQGW
jgi:hypothetical protein